MICLSLTGTTLEENLAQIRENRRWISLAELRGDLLKEEELPGLNRFPSLTDLPLILTIRRSCDGGRWPGNKGGEGCEGGVGGAGSGSGGPEPDGPVPDSPAPDRPKFKDEARGALFSRCLDAGYRYFDLEEDLPPQPWEEDWLARGGRIIRSFHDFTGVPEDLEKRIRELPRREGEIPKAAVTPRDGEGLLRIFRAAEALGDSPRIILGMGNPGIPTRILARRLGSILTFASVPGTAVPSAAPGQLSPRALEELYHYSKISPKTRIFGIIGFPVLHSLSPAIHNRGFAESRYDGVYVPVELENPGEFPARAGEFGFAGFSVTHPYKETVLPLLEDQDPAVRGIGACNTLVRTPSGGWRGFNTDAPGFSAPLEKIWAGVFAGKTALVIGAGGAARGVIWELLRRKVSVRLANRSAGRARRLAEDFGIPWEPLGDGSRLPAADLIVQASPVGMEGFPGDPARGYRFSGRELVYDLIYRPEETVFLERARRSGCQTLSGMEMLLAQARIQFKLFTGLDYPGEFLSDANLNL